MHVRESYTRIFLGSGQEAKNRLEIRRLLSLVYVPGALTATFSWRKCGRVASRPEAVTVKNVRYRTYPKLLIGYREHKALRVNSARFARVRRGLRGLRRMFSEESGVWYPECYYRGGGSEPNESEGQREGENAKVLSRKCPVVAAVLIHDAPQRRGCPRVHVCNQQWHDHHHAVRLFHARGDDPQCDKWPGRHRNREQRVL